MNGFERHGIKHLSPSSINLWIGAPDVWVAKYLHGHRQPFGASGRRGQCIESAVVAVLQGGAMDEAVGMAVAAFDETFPLGSKPFPLGDEKTTRERDLIAPMTALAVKELETFGCPAFVGDGQDGISINAKIGEWTIPVIGYLDMVFPDHGLVVDLKTTTRIPSVMSEAHQLQRCVYDASTGNRAVRFLYVSAKTAKWHEDGETRDVLARAKLHIARMEKFLSLHDADSALACVPFNPSSFYWTGDEAGRERLFGF